MSNPNPSPATRFTSGPDNKGGGRNPAKRAAGQACWDALLADFKEFGIPSIIAFREAFPAAYVTLVASGLPIESRREIEVRRVESLSEEQARMMAEEIIAQYVNDDDGSISAGASGVDTLHDSL